MKICVAGNRRSDEFEETLVRVTSTGGLALRRVFYTGALASGETPASGEAVRRPGCWCTRARSNLPFRRIFA